MRKLSFLSSVLSVSALLFALGSCTEGNIDNGDNTGGDQTPGEPVVYKVGDPYVVNGNTVGIVYEVDETGTHGKAYSLTVYNLSLQEAGILYAITCDAGYFASYIECEQI